MHVLMMFHTIFLLIEKKIHIMICNSRLLQHIGVLCVCRREWCAEGSGGSGVHVCLGEGEGLDLVAGFQPYCYKPCAPLHFVRVHVYMLISVFNCRAINNQLVDTYQLKSLDGQFGKSNLLSLSNKSAGMQHWLYVSKTHFSSWNLKLDQTGLSVYM